MSTFYYTRSRYKCNISTLSIWKLPSGQPFLHDSACKDDANQD